MPKRKGATACRWRLDATQRVATTACCVQVAGGYTAVVWLILEALLALLLFVFIIWWVMFSGRKRGERAPPRDNSDAD
jgi:hypothetical protein